MSWYGRVLAYNGNEGQAKIILKKAVEMESMDDVAKKALKNIRRSAELKEEASGLFK
jgi:hypothetical protein